MTDDDDAKCLRDDAQRKPKQRTTHPGLSFVRRGDRDFLPLDLSVRVKMAKLATVIRPETPMSANTYTCSKQLVALPIP